MLIGSNVSKVLNDLQIAYATLLQLPSIKRSIAKDHLYKTPGRCTKALHELLDGYDVDPAQILTTSFTAGKYDEMITVGDIRFTSLCAHHILPFFGRVYFAYIPKRRIVGLSKIPRIIEVFSHRLQVQENMTDQIADCFQRTVKPVGCAVLVEAHHMCMSIRGVKKEGYMRTTALRGIFKRDASAKEEFLRSIK